MDVEIPMTEAKANAFARKLFRNHKQCMKEWHGERRTFKRRGYRWYSSYWIRKGSRFQVGPEPFIKIEFERISA